jgi:genome maintenance exonuclease 1
MVRKDWLLALSFKWNKQFDYPTSMRTSVEGKRHYEITGEKLPSVTTILSATQSDEKKESIAKWTAKVGEEQATRVRDQATWLK